MTEPEKSTGESQDIAAVKRAELKQLLFKSLLFYRNRDISDLDADDLLAKISASKVGVTINSLYWAILGFNCLHY